MNIEKRKKNVIRNMMKNMIKVRFCLYKLRANEIGASQSSLRCWSKEYEA